MKKEVNAYVDGSFSDKCGYPSYAFIIVDRTKKYVIGIDFGVIALDELVPIRNVGGELFSVIYALNYCEKAKIKNVAIYYDYIGIEKFVQSEREGGYKVKNNQAFIRYQQEMAYYKWIGINYTFHKVKAHSGNAGNNIDHYWNDKVDKLAKQAYIKYAKDNPFLDNEVHLDLDLDLSV